MTWFDRTPTVCPGSEQEPDEIVRIGANERGNPQATGRCLVCGTEQLIRKCVIVAHAAPAPKEA